MSTKRKNQAGEGTQTPGPHSRKKARVQEARQIAIQEPTHFVNGMRLIILDRDSMNLSKVSSSKSLSLDVEKFANVSICRLFTCAFTDFCQARRFEITAMQDAITNAR